MAGCTGIWLDEGTKTTKTLTNDDDASVTHVETLAYRNNMVPFQFDGRCVNLCLSPQLFSLPYFLAFLIRTYALLGSSLCGRDLFEWDNVVPYAPVCTLEDWL